MSIEAKTRFLNNIKNRLSDALTVSTMNNLLDNLSDELNNFDIIDITPFDNNGDEDDMLKAFINALHIEGRSPKTIKRYEYIIGKMLNHLQLSTSQISVFDIRKYLSDKKAAGISDRTIEGERQIFSSYFGWLYRESMLKYNPISNIGAIKCCKKIKDIFSDVDIELMKKSCNNIKESALITFLLSTGCRVSEMCSLNRSDIDFANLECKVLGKGNKERIVYLDEISGMFLKQYLDTRKDDNEALFINIMKERLCTNGVRKLFKNIEARSGVKNIHPHKFRRTLATNLIKHGMPIQEVAAILGHDKLDTTMEYIVLDKSEIEHSYRKFS